MQLMPCAEEKMRQAPALLLVMFKVKALLGFPSAQMSILIHNSRSWKCDYSHEAHRKSRTPRSAQEQQPQHTVRVVHRSTSLLKANTAPNSAATHESWISDIEFPAAFFLDPHVFKKHQMPIPRANLVSPRFYSSFLENEADVLSQVTLYFDSVHKWMPIISEERIYACLEKPLRELSSDTALLLLCMRMITWTPSKHSEDPRTEIYLAAKQCFANLETSGILSIRGLEAGLLISIYEIGHAIYPSAFLTAGACVRYGYALGLGRSDAMKICRPFSRDELQENTRLWWAVILVHRYESSVTVL